MTVDTRAHIESSTLQDRAVLRRTTVCAHVDNRYARRKAVAVKGHSGDAIRISLADLGDALRVLKVSAADLGYKQRARR